MKVIFYGADEYASRNFHNLSETYEPICFCDRKAMRADTFCGLPLLSPKTLLKEKYRNVPIYITLNPSTDRRLEVQAWLIEELGVAVERIIDFEPYKTILSCWEAECRIDIDSDYAALCCHNRSGKNVPPRVDFAPGSSPSDKVKAIQELRKRIYNNLEQGISSECDGCCALIKKYIKLGAVRVNPDRTPLRHFEYFFRHSCNLQCVYCSQRSTQTSVIDMTDLFAVTDEMKRVGMLDENTKFVSALGGELSTHPQRAQLLSIAVKLGGRNLVFSNCLIYDDIIADYSKIGPMTINCSVDSGTRETYKKIKGRDCFDKVSDNLKLYAQTADIELKYIFVEGMNDNELDIDGFTELVDEIHRINPNTVCQISRDTRYESRNRRVSKGQADSPRDTTA